MESVDRSLRQKRALRGAGAAAVATTVAATAHTLSGGEAPPAWLLVAVTLLAMPIAVALTARRPSLWRTSAVVTSSQILLHVAFATAGTASPGSIGHVHGTAVSLTGTVVFGDDPVVIDPVMLAGHLWAAAITVLLIVRGERALRAIAAGLRHIVRRVFIAPHRPLARVLVVALDHGTVTTTVALTSLSRRGPPAVAL